MGLPIVATPGAADANSYLTLAEALEYFEGRLEVPEWENADSQEGLLIMATRLIDAMYSPMRKLVKGKTPSESYYIIRPTWTGTPASTTQYLAWPRDGMFDRNGNAILNTVIPQDLKNATAELAAHLAKEDRSFDSDAALQGIRSVKAGSVAVTFGDQIMSVVSTVIPDIVFSLLVPSWLTDEMIEWGNSADFIVVS